MEPYTATVLKRTGGYSKTATKKKRIPRPLNAFMIFANKNRAKLKVKYPEKSNSDISIKLGQIWQELSVLDRTPYYMESQQALIEHKMKHPNYSYTPGSPKNKKSYRPTPLKSLTQDIDPPLPQAAKNSFIPSGQSQNQEAKLEPQSQVTETSEYVYESTETIKNSHVPQMCPPGTTISHFSVPHLNFKNTGNCQSMISHHIPMLPPATLWPTMAQPPPSLIPFHPSALYPTYPYFYDQPFSPGPSYVWSPLSQYHPTPTATIPCFYPGEMQMNYTPISHAGHAMNNHFVPGNLFRYQTPNISYEDLSHIYTRGTLHLERPQQNVSTESSVTNKSQELNSKICVDNEDTCKECSETNIHSTQCMMNISVAVSKPPPATLPSESPC